MTIVGISKHLCSSDGTIIFRKCIIYRLRRIYFYDKQYIHSVNSGIVFLALEIKDANVGNTFHYLS